MHCNLQKSQYGYLVPIFSLQNQQQSALVNQGANGGIIGENVHIIAKTGHQVDIQGFDNHHTNDIYLVSSGGVVNK